MDQTSRTAGTKRVLSAVAMATLWPAGAGGGVASDAPATKPRSVLGCVRFGAHLAVGLALAVGMLAETARGEINTSQGSGYWTNAAVWSDGIPTADDDVFIRSGHAITNTGLGAIVVNSLVVASNAIVTHVNGPTNAIHLKLTGDLMIDSGGAICVNGRGYPASTGIGLGAGCAGGGHGGESGCWKGLGGSIPSTTYDSVTNPVLPGSGSVAGHNGTAGGGVVIVRAAKVTLDGRIAAEGEHATNPGSSAGAGGSVNIRAGDLQGRGTISVAGGNCLINPTGSPVGAGGGGRIAVVLTNSSTFGNVEMTAVGGMTSWSRSYWWGGAGTIYLQSANQTHGLLVVSNIPGATHSERTLIGPLTTDAVVGDVKLLGSAKFAVSKDCTLTVYGNWSNAATYAMSGDGMVEFADTNPTPVYVWGGNAGSKPTNATAGKVVRVEANKVLNICGRPAAAADETVVLDNTTLWRQFQVAGASHRRQATGKLVRYEPHGWDSGAVAQGRLGRTSGNVGSIEFSEGSKSAFWSPLPPSDWAGLAFDDSVWPRAWLPQPAVYYRRDGANAGEAVLGRANRPYDPVMVLARGKFEVKDPAQIRACVFSLEYWGGVVVYVNGKEVARGHLSIDATNTESVADDYPPEAFTTPDGKLLKHDDDKNADRLALRLRRLEVRIPANLLRKGINVVAIECHAAPIGASELLRGDGRLYETAVWPPIGLLSARLAVAPAGAAVANVLRPHGVQVWNREVADTVTPFDYGDPTEPLRPVSINAGRNTVFSGRLVVGSDLPIRGLKVNVTDLRQTQTSAKISASAIRVRCAATTSTPGKSWMNPYRFDGLFEAIPAEIPVIVAPVRCDNLAANYLRSAGWSFYSRPVDLTIFVPGAVAPLWFTVCVPRNATPGVYEGTASVEAEGLRPTIVPLRVDVSAWTARDPKNFRLQLFPYSLEESLAMYYDVPLWSDRHFELIGQSLALGAEINARQVFANLVVEADGSGSNPESMIRWIKQPDGSYKHDFTIFDKYLETVAKAIGKPHPLQLGWAGEPPPAVSVFDPHTGKIERTGQPAYQDAEASAAFWRPVFEEIRKKLTARGWTDETILACTYRVGGPPLASTIDVANKLWPGGEWGFFSHQGPVTFVGGDTNTAMKVRLLAHVYNNNGPHNVRMTWEPSSRFIQCKLYRNNAAAGGLGYASTLEDLPLMEMRWRPEEMLRMGMDGWASFGLDAFPLKKPSGGYYHRGRSFGTRGWCHGITIMALLYPGPDGPVATERYEALREGMQLTEALLDIEQAIAANQPNPLGADLLQRAVRYRDERNASFAYGWFGPRSVQTDDDRQRLDLAGEVVCEMEGKK